MARRDRDDITGSDETEPPGGRAADVFVAIAIAVVVFAAATALNLQAGVDIKIAVAAGVVTYAALLGLHIGVKSIARRRMDGNSDRLARDFEHLGVGHYRGPRLPVDDAADAEALAPLRAQRPPVAAVALPPLNESTSHPAAAPARSMRGAVPAFRPASMSDLAGGPAAPSARSASPPAARGDAPLAATRGDAPMEADVERIQALVKKLANEINAADHAAATRREPIYAASPRLTPEAGIEVAIGALRQTAEGMRGAPPPSPVAMPPVLPQAPAAVDPGPVLIRPVASQPRQAKPQPQPNIAPPGAASPSHAAPAAGSAAVPPPLSPAQVHIAAVADALVAGRVDVEIEPIVSLADQRTRHYEVSINVRSAAEERLVDNGDFSSLQGTGLLPLFDSARLQRSVGIAQRLAERAKEGRVLSTYSIESLTNAGFLSDVRATVKSADIGAQIVMGFELADIRACTPAEWAALAELRQLGVGFCVDNLAHLDLDVKRLASHGFAFARIDVARFVSGVSFGGQPVSGAELNRYLTGGGLTLIVGHVDDDTRLQRSAAFGATLAQGKVFGGPRQVKLVAQRSSHAAA